MLITIINVRLILNKKPMKKYLVKTRLDCLVGRIKKRFLAPSVLEDSETE
jgi:hypothetical protein